MAATKDFSIGQGKTFNPVLRWGAPPYIYKPITGITQAAPAVVTAASHGVPDGWRVAVVSVKGMTQINAENNPPKSGDYVIATPLNSNTVELNEVNASEYKPYVSGGYLQFLTPVDMTGFTARMSIKDRVGGTEYVSLTTENGGIVIDNTNKKISLLISATDTSEFTWTRGVYELEMVSAGGIVTLLLEGKITVSKEVTA